MKTVKLEDLITIEEYDKKRNYSKKEWAEIEKGVMKILKKMELKENRLKQKMSQSALAKKANLPRSTIARIESGRANPRFNTLKQIANSLNMELEIRFFPKK